MLNFGIERTLANHVGVAYLAYMEEPPLLVCQKLSYFVFDENFKIYLSIKM